MVQRPTTLTTARLDDRDIAWLRPMTQFLAARGLAAPAFPLPVERLYGLFATLGYELNEHVLKQEHGEVSPTYTVADARRLHGRLERGGFWQTFPCAAHDHKKAVDQLAIEAAQWLGTLHPNYRKAWAVACDTRYLLMLLARASDATTQSTLLTAATHKFGCTPVTSPQFWPQLCEDVATMTQLLDNEPGAKADPK